MQEKDDNFNKKLLKIVQLKKLNKKKKMFKNLNKKLVDRSFLLNIFFNCGILKKEKGENYGKCY